jgi:hypothetical protein
MRFTGLLAVLLVPTSALAQPSRSEGWPCQGKVDPSFVRAAEETGGKVLLLKPTELAGATADFKASSQHEETVLRVGGTLAEGLYEFAVPIDSTIESVYFVVSMQCLQDAVLVLPSGVALGISDPAVEYHHFESVRLFIVQQPAPGLWKVTTRGRGLVSLIVTAKTELRLGGVRYADGGVPVVSESKLGKNLQLEALTFGAPREVGFQFVGRDAARIADVDLLLEKDSDLYQTYSSLVVTPTVDFRLAMVGQDANGFPFQRIEPQLSGAVKP